MKQHLIRYVLAAIFSLLSVNNTMADESWFKTSALEELKHLRARQETVWNDATLMDVTAADGKKYDYRQNIISSLGAAIARLLYNGTTHAVDRYGHLTGKSHTFGMRDAKPKTDGLDEQKILVDAWASTLVMTSLSSMNFKKCIGIKPTTNKADQLNHFLLDFLAEFITITIDDYEIYHSKFTPIPPSDATTLLKIKTKYPLYNGITSEVLEELAGEGFSAKIIRKLNEKGEEPEINSDEWDTGLLSTWEFLEHEQLSTVSIIITEATKDDSSLDFAALGAWLRRSKTIQNLIIACPMNSEEFKHIVDALSGEDRNTSLTQLGFVKCGIDSASIKYLADALSGEGQNTPLTHLIIGGSDIGSTGAKHIARALSSEGKNKTLAFLDLWGSNIGSEGAGYIADALSDKAGNIILRYLNLWDNNLRPVDKERLKERLKLIPGLKSVL